ncbi:MAG: hypoxanthine phosphoribosyltransferase [Candidatus Latescibacterota bacterium]|jgi:hypoxanthine phosphoribosyltransferase
MSIIDAHMVGDVQLKTLIDRQRLETRIAELAQELSRDYAETRPLLIGVLNGAAPFMMALVAYWPQITRSDIDYDFVDVSSYDGQESSGCVRLIKDLNMDIAGRDVILVEDIVDTGLTMQYLLAELSARRPRSLKICSLLDKRARRRIDMPVDYCGFAIDDLFVVGFGLDYNQRYRALDYIAVLE